MPGHWTEIPCVVLHVVISNVIASETLALLKNQIREYTQKMGIDHATIEIELPS